MLSIMDILDVVNQQSILETYSTSWMEQISDLEIWESHSSQSQFYPEYWQLTWRFGFLLNGDFQCSKLFYEYEIVGVHNDNFPLKVLSKSFSDGRLIQPLFTSWKHYQHLSFPPADVGWCICLLWEVDWMRTEGTSKVRVSNCFIGFSEVIFCTNETYFSVLLDERFLSILWKDHFLYQEY